MQWRQNMKCPVCNATTTMTEDAIQKGVKRSLETPGGRGLSTVGFWYKAGHFKTKAHAEGAFELAHLQYMDGVASSHAEWMGLTDAELTAWMESGALPELAKDKQPPGWE